MTPYRDGSVLASTSPRGLAGLGTFIGAYDLAQDGPLREGALFDLHEDPAQESPIVDDDVELRMIELLRRLMVETDAPPGQFERLVILMIVNGLVLSVLYVTYPRDTARVGQELELRRRQELAD
ncbi:hypothetical protein [Nonomuraea jabiensis]|uniref:Uncharacterized protein n=1 Tax=Nonomuraea jabiensis TaxID=882448 RepID=A0A7W9GFD2_9ACTN|nr:hypothetical protein [Nonomuraea jabiensis]MBB5782556.1 hypothetical protein [Nonomuraea jabiensis]